AAPVGAVAVGLAPVGELAADDGEQPVAEGAAARVVLQPADGPGHSPQHVLAEVGGVGVLQPLLARVAVGQGRVQIDELTPGIPRPGVAQAQEEAGAGGGYLGHQSLRHCLPTYSTGVSQKPTTAATGFLGQATREQAGAVSPPGVKATGGLRPSLAG